jgi:hypothetical protein
VRVITTLAVLSLVTTAATFAQATRQVGPWSIYDAAGNTHKTTMLQTTSVDQQPAESGSAAPTKLDIICKNDKVAAIAVETKVKVNRRNEIYSQAVPTTRVVFTIEGQVSESENWAVADGGHTLYPYSELFQGKLNRIWVTRISGTRRLALRLNQTEGTESLAPAFDTADLAQALSAAGCTE